MADLYRIRTQNFDIDSDFYDLARIAEENRQLDYNSAVKIQSWIRGCRVRIYLKSLNKAAGIIQRKWRGFLGRQEYGKFDMAYMARVAYYNRMSEKIQCVWRGFYTRKYIFNFYTRKHYLHSLVIKNDIIRSELNNYCNQQLLLEKINEEDIRKRALLNYASTHHHLISTISQPGVFNSPYKSCPSEIELHLRTRQAGKTPKPKKPLTYDPSCSSYNAGVRRSLPPLAVKPQGPFVEPAVVQKQRYRPFLPTLRVETDFYSLEKAQRLLKDAEWTKRVHDDVLVVGDCELCSRLCNALHQMHPYNLTKLKPYERLLSSTAAYGHLAYGSNHFRELHTRSFVSTQDFKMLVPSIPIFDKFTATYSKGEV